MSLTKPTRIYFNQGIQYPPQLGSLILKLAAANKLSYGQNIDTSPNEYGVGEVTPGPALSLITNNSDLDGVPFLKQFYGQAVSSIGYIYIAEGILGSVKTIRRVKNILSGSTPQLDTVLGAIVSAHSGHANPTITDMVLRVISGTPSVYVVAKDDTDVYLDKFNPNNGTPTLSNVYSISNITGGLTLPFLVLGSDGNVYLIGQQRVDSIDSTDTQVLNALSAGLPKDLYASAGCDWRKQLVVACSTDGFGDFSVRKGGGQAWLVLWDYTSPSWSDRIPAPCRFISAVVPDPNGGLLVFGGVDQGKSSIYSFNGYGFDLLTSYIGDLPRTRHSVEFDEQGRIVWMTADGFYCRYDRKTGIFDHLGTGSTSGGLLAKMIGSPAGNEFLLGSGAGSTYKLQIVSFGNYTGDGNASPDNSSTPKAVSGLQQTLDDTTITAITLHIAKPLASGEVIRLQVYENGSTTPTAYLTMDYSVDGAVTSKRVAFSIPNLSCYLLEAAWKMTDAQATAPPLLFADVETNV